MAIIIADGDTDFLKASLGSSNSLNNVSKAFDVSLKYFRDDIFDVQSCWGFSCESSCVVLIWNKIDELKIG